MVKLIPYPEIPRYNQIFQSISLLFAFVTKKDNTYTQIFYPVKCRDYLGDCIWSKKSKDTANIYGFIYNYEKTPFDEDMLRMSLTFPSKEKLQTFLNNNIFLLEKQEKGKTKQTLCLKTNDPLTWIIEADPIWQSSPWKLSLFTYYLKLMCYDDVSKPSTPEIGYAPYLTPEIENKFLNKLDVMEEEIAPSVETAHNYSGFLSIIKSNKYPYVDYPNNMNTLLLGE